MEMIAKIWDATDGKYVSEESIWRCWRKADILPATWIADINNTAGSTSLTAKHKMISNELCDELCQLMTNVKIKVVECVDTSAIDGLPPHSLQLMLIFRQTI